MNFEGALTLLKEGKKLRRRAWPHSRFILAIDLGVDPLLGIWNGDEPAAPWIPTQEHIFAEDWELFQDGSAFVELAGLTGKLRFHSGFFEWESAEGSLRVTMRDLGESLRYARR